MIYERRPVPTIEERIELVKKLRSKCSEEKNIWIDTTDEQREHLDSLWEKMHGKKKKTNKFLNEYPVLCIQHTHGEYGDERDLAFMDEYDGRIISLYWWEMKYDSCCISPYTDLICAEHNVVGFLLDFYEKHKNDQDVHHDLD